MRLLRQFFAICILTLALSISALASAGEMQTPGITPPPPPPPAAALAGESEGESEPPDSREPTETDPLMEILLHILRSMLSVG